MGKLIQSYKELHVYQNAFEAALKIFDLTKNFPSEEKYSLVDQIRRCSRSVCSNIAEAWRKRLYKAAFIAKLNDVLSEATETEVWLEFAFRCDYINEKIYNDLEKDYNQIIGQIVNMIDNADSWVIKKKK